MSGCLSQACLDGIAAGEAAANAILLRRIGDGFATPHLPYTLAAGPGVYQPTPPTPPAPAPNPPVLNAGWAKVTAVRATQRLAIPRRSVANVRSDERGIHARLQ